MPNFGKEFEELTVRETYAGPDGKPPKGWASHEKEAPQGYGDPSKAGRAPTQASDSFGTGLR